MKAINYSSSICTRTRKSVFSGLCAPGTRVFDWRCSMLGDITRADNIYVVTGYTDMRRSIDGLVSIIIDHLHMVPDLSSIYLFCGKRCDRIKVLMKEPDGFVLLYKRLDSNIQGRFRWPRNSSEVKYITWKQFDWLMSGLEIEQPKALKKIG